MDNKTIVQRLTSLESQRTNIQAKWDDIDRFIMPLDQGKFAAKADSENSKDWSSEEMWDSTAAIGAERLASLFYSGLISGRWLGLAYGSPAVNKVQKAKAWIQDTVDRMIETVMASDFPSEFASTCRSWVSYGNGCMTEELVGDEGKWAGLAFGSHPIREIFFEQDWRGRVYRVYRPMRWTPSQIVSKFRDPNDPSKPHPSIPEAIVKQAEGPNGEPEKIDVIFAVYPREGAKPMKLGEKGRAPDQRPFGYKYVLRQGLTTLGEEGGYYEMPTFVARYSRSPTSMWGYGPGLLSLPTVKLLNALLEQVFNAGAKVIDPATIVTERGLLSDLNLGPQEMTIVRSIDDIKAYESAARFDVSDSLLAELRMMVRKFFREDDITLKESPQMSATEATIRDDRLDRLFGPQVRQMHFDLLGPVAQTTFNHMLREGQLEKIPDEVVEADPRIQVQFYGRFMRAQRTDEVTAIERLLASVAAAQKMQMPRSKHIVKVDAAFREMGNLLSVPATMLATEQEVEDAEKQDRQIAEAAAKAEIAKTAAEANRAQAGAVDMAGGSGGMMGGAGGA